MPEPTTAAAALTPAGHEPGPPRSQLLLPSGDPAIVRQEGTVDRRVREAGAAAERARKASTHAAEAVVTLAQSRQHLDAARNQAARARAAAERAREGAVGASRNSDVSKTATATRKAAEAADAAVTRAEKAERRAAEQYAQRQQQRMTQAARAKAAQKRLDRSRRYLEALRRDNRPRRAVVRTPQDVGTPNGGRVHDPGYEGRRPDDPQPGHRFSKFPRTDSNYQLMLAGRPPIGSDGLPVNLHHRGGAPMGRLEEYTQTQHQNLGLHGDIEDSRIDRAAFDNQRARYWVTRARQELKIL